MEWTSGLEGTIASAFYPVKVDGGRGGNSWVRTRFTTGGFAHDNHAAFVDCDVIDGPQRRWGGTPSSLIACDAEQDGWSNDFTVTVRLATLAEASGTITSTNVYLADGTFQTGVASHHPGAEKVVPGDSTSFYAVFMGGDNPFYENQARTEFSYQIVDHGDRTGLWVAGLSTNYRGALTFSGDGRCAIYDSNPLEGKDHLDSQHPIQGSGFTCTATGEMLHGIGEKDNRHFDGTYTITKG